MFNLNPSFRNPSHGDGGMGWYMPKEGYVREDGMVYWRYRKDRGDVWLTPEKYASYCKKRKDYNKICVEAYKERQAKLPDSEKNYFGKYDWKKNKYFVGITTSGKEVWMYKARFEKRVQENKKYKRKHLNKLQKLPLTGLKIGDRNPDNPEQFVLGFMGHKPRFGSHQELIIANEARKLVGQKIRARYKKLREEKLNNLPKKMRRGDVDQSSGLIFWAYNLTGKPIWLQPEIYTTKHNKELAKKRVRRRKILLSKDSNK